MAMFSLDLTDKRFYRERKSFLCIDGSKMIPFEQVNDDYCDCADGSDEPGKHGLIIDESSFRFQDCVITSCRHRRLTLSNIMFLFYCLEIKCSALLNSNIKAVLQYSV